MTDWILDRTDAPILAAEQPWEIGATLSAMALHTDPQTGGLRLYYLVSHREDPLRNVLCVATSDSGSDWAKPDLGEGSNIVMGSLGLETGWGIFMPTRIIHEPEEDNPAWRWKMVLWERPHLDTPAGICLAVSADGLKWHHLHERPIITSANDAMSMVAAQPGVQTPRESRYLLYQQTWKYNPHLPGDRDNLVGIHRQISLWYNGGDFDGRWTGPITVLEPDEEDPPDLQHYWLSPYPTASGYGGLLFCHHTLDQTMDVQRVSSPDGWLWEHCDDRVPLLALGERGRFDSGMITAASMPCRFGERVLLPYNGRATVHDQQQRYPGDPAITPGIGLVELDKELLA
ncbi:MAG: hypothetical protein HN712_28340 [Gemmatimonadetes bacterium]|jgi:hypothetical protein|nr:hypothetical protein [Gemmatimonadota bacterium]MBT6144097.1 hypothetical protein [Gemmatimonadota bacterium]MBT7864254.1 hypothetical protein [Gemmatimonadota bacterium]